MEKLAALIQHRLYHTETLGTADGRLVVQLNRDNRVADQLCISVDELERSYEALARELIVKRLRGYRVEILNDSQLAAIAKGAKK